MQPFELRGDGIVLAVPTADDIDRVTAICQDAEIQRWLTAVNPPFTREQAAHFVTEVVPASWADGSELIWAVRDQEDRRVIGMIGVGPITGGKAEIGFWLAPEARGSGVMAGAVRVVADYAFDPEGLALTHLGWKAIVGNWASRRVAWATGFRFEGTIRGDLVKQGRRHDAWVASLCAGEPMKPAGRWLDVPVLRSERVVLRPFAETDADAIVEACNDPVSQHWLAGLPSPYTREIALTYVHDRREQAATGSGVHWAAALPDGGPAVGSFSLMGVSSRDGGAEVGYWVHPRVRGTGVATAAVALMTEHAFADQDAGGLGLRRLVVAHVTGNDASRTVIERSGFRPIGLERAGQHLRGGAIVDLHWYDLLLDDDPPAGEQPGDEQPGTR